MNNNLPNANIVQENIIFIDNAKLEEPIYCEREQVIAVSRRSRYNNKKLRSICITVILIELALVSVIILIIAMNMFIIN
tara:strand:+ start:2085 stop:2321 length:237 start_codon:yes stop_codon:yes gene_type:complete